MGGEIVGFQRHLLELERALWNDHHRRAGGCKHCQHAMYCVAEKVLNLVVTRGQYSSVRRRFIHELVPRAKSSIKLGLFCFSRVYNVQYAIVYSSKRSVSLPIESPKKLSSSSSSTALKCFSMMQGYSGTPWVIPLATLTRRRTPLAAPATG